MPEIVIKLGSEDVATHGLAQDVIRIGRSRDNDIVLDHLSVSRHHAEIRLDNGHWIISDLESANGTFVNGQRITTVPLYHADTITVGKHHLHFFDTPLEQDSQRIHDYDEEKTVLMDQLPSTRGCLTISKGKERGREYVLNPDRTLIGRASDCDIQLSDWLVSKYHAQIMQRNEEFIIEDLGSWRAIQVNGVPIKKVKLHDGDTIQLGSTRLSFRQISPQDLKKHQDEDLVPEEEFSDSYKLAVVAAAEMADGSEAGARVYEATPEDSEAEPSGEDYEAAESEEVSPEAREDEARSEEPTGPVETTDEEWDAAPFGEVPEQPEYELADEELAGAHPGAEEQTDEAAFAEGEEALIAETEKEDRDGNGRDFESAEETEDELDAASPSGEDFESDAEEVAVQASAEERREVDLWTQALEIGGPALRRHAARQLKRLTGKDYE